MLASGEGRASGLTQDASGGAAAGGAAGVVGRYRWLVCALLFFATTVNYMDRQILSLLKPILDNELKWTNAQFGMVNAAFQAAYAVGLLSFGALIDRVGTKIGYAVSISAWSLAAMAHALVGSVNGFFAARIALGLGEGGNFPSAIKAVAIWFPPRERAYATALFNSGSNVGAIIAPAVVPWMATSFGWRSAFVAAGIAGLIWLAFWIPWYDVPERICQAERRRAGPHPQPGRGRARRRRRGAHLLGGDPAPPSGLGVHRRQVPHRSRLVVFSHLAARLLQEDARARHQGQLGLPGDDLFDRHGAQHLRRLALRLPHRPRA